MSTLRTSAIQSPSTTNGGISIDTSGHVTVDGVALPSAGPLSNRNKIINGDMRIDQRNAGASVTLGSSGAYPVDRFFCVEDSDGAMTAQQSTSAPAGFSNSIRFTTTTADSSLIGGQFACIQQMVEGYNVANLNFGTANAQTFTLSFWVRSSLTGTFGGSLANGAHDRSYAFTYSISSANTWEYKTITVAGDTSGTWLTTNGKGLKITWGLGVSSSYSGTAGSWNSALYLSATGAVSVIGTLNATFDITGVQLEAGSVATPFERRSYGQELALCQRYYELIPGGIYSAYANVAGANGRGTALYYAVTKRATPTITYNGVSEYIAAGSGGVNATFSTMGITDSFFNPAVMSNIPSGIFNICYTGGTGTAGVQVNAEL